MKASTRSTRLPLLSLQLGLAFVFAYAGIDAIREPDVWIGFLPPFLSKLLPQQIVLDGFSIFQLVLAAALMWKRSAFYGAVASTAILTGITLSSYVMDPHSFLITFRDVGLALASLSLALATRP